MSTNKKCICSYNLNNIKNCCYHRNNKNNNQYNESEILIKSMMASIQVIVNKEYQQQTDKNNNYQEQKQKEYNHKQKQKQEQDLIDEIKNEIIRERDRQKLTNEWIDDIDNLNISEDDKDILQNYRREILDKLTKKFNIIDKKIEIENDINNLNNFNFIKLKTEFDEKDISFFNNQVKKKIRELKQKNKYNKIIDELDIEDNIKNLLDNGKWDQKINENQENFSNTYIVLLNNYRKQILNKLQEDKFKILKNEFNKIKNMIIIEEKKENLDAHCCKKMMICPDQCLFNIIETSQILSNDYKKKLHELRNEQISKIQDEDLEILNNIIKDEYDKIKNGILTETNQENLKENGYWFIKINESFIVNNQEYLDDLYKLIIEQNNYLIQQNNNNQMEIEFPKVEYIYQMEEIKYDIEENNNNKQQQAFFNWLQIKDKMIQETSIDKLENNNEWDIQIKILEQQKNYLPEYYIDILQLFRYFLINKKILERKIEKIKLLSNYQIDDMEDIIYSQKIILIKKNDDKEFNDSQKIKNIINNIVKDQNNIIKLQGYWRKYIDENFETEYFKNKFHELLNYLINKIESNQIDNKKKLGIEYSNQENNKKRFFENEDLLISKKRRCDENIIQKRYELGTYLEQIKWLLDEFEKLLYIDQLSNFLDKKEAIGDIIKNRYNTINISNYKKKFLDLLFDKWIKCEDDNYINNNYNIDLKNEIYKLIKDINNYLDQSKTESSSLSFSSSIKDQLKTESPSLSFSSSIKDQSKTDSPSLSFSSSIKDQHKSEITSSSFEQPNRLLFNPNYRISKRNYPMIIIKPKRNFNIRNPISILRINYEIFDAETNIEAIMTEYKKSLLNPLDISKENFNFIKYKFIEQFNNYKTDIDRSKYLKFIFRTLVTRDYKDNEINNNVFNLFNFIY